MAFDFNTNHFTAAWKALGVRPAVGDPHAEKTDERYCLYDERHKDYGYTEAYVAKLVRECKTEAGFRKLLGTAPKDKATGDWVGPPPPSATPPWKRTRDAGPAPSPADSVIDSPAGRGRPPRGDPLQTGTAMPPLA